MKKHMRKPSKMFLHKFSDLVLFTLNTVVRQKTVHDEVLVKNQLMEAFDAYMISSRKTADKTLATILAKGTSLDPLDVFKTVAKFQRFKKRYRKYNLPIGPTDYLIHEFLEKMPNVGLDKYERS